MSYWGEAGTTVTWKNPTKVPESQRQSGGWYYNPDSNRVDRWWSGDQPQQQSSGGGGGGGTDYGAILKQQQDEAARKEAEAKAAYEAEQARGQAYLTKAAGEEQSLLDKFTGAIKALEPSQAIYKRLGEEQGLPGLKSTAEQFTSQVKAIPENVKALATQIPISTTRQAQRVTQQLENLAPRQQEAVTQFQNSLSEVSRQLGFALEDQKTQLEPFAYAFQQLSDRIAREMSGYSTNIQNSLNILLNRLTQTGNLSQTQLANAYEMAKQEADYLNQKDLLSMSNQFIEGGGHKLLVNSITGDIIADYGKTSTGTGGGWNWQNSPAATPTGLEAGDLKTGGYTSSSVQTDIDPSLLKLGEVNFSLGNYGSSGQ